MVMAMNPINRSVPHSWICWRRGVFTFLIFLLTISKSYAASLDTRVDRETVIDGETIVLYIEGSGLSGLPDTSVLLQAFRIIQSGVSRSQTIINGQRTSGFEVRLELQAKNTGTNTIPAMTVDGVSSSPITVNVVTRGTPGVEPRDKAFVELSVDNDTPYVQEQIVLSLMIFDDGNLASADPNIEGNGDYQIERLPAAGEQLVERDGVRYRVHTFRYALFPQKSGELVIDSISVPASIRDKSYGGNLILRNTPTRRIEMRTEPLVLQVKPRPAASTASWWLPVKALELNHQWSGDIANAKSGEPFTLTLELSSVGATATQLPEISVPSVDGLKIYNDVPVMATDAQDNNITSVRREKWSVNAQRSGLLTLPEVVIKWWDTVADQERQVTLPEQQINVAASDQSSVLAGSEQSEATVPQGAADLTVQSELVSDSDTPSLETDGAASVSPLAGIGTGLGSILFWQWFALVAMAAWLLTLLMWWRSVRATGNGSDKSIDKAEAEPSREWRKLKSASRNGDIKAYSASMLRWANSRWPDDPVHNLPEISRRLGSIDLAEKMRLIDQVRYAGYEIDSAEADMSRKEIPREIQAQLEHDLKNHQRHLPSPSANALPQL